MPRWHVAVVLDVFSCFAVTLDIRMRKLAFWVCGLTRGGADGGEGVINRSIEPGIRDISQEI